MFSASTENYVLDHIECDCAVENSVSIDINHANSAILLIDLFPVILFYGIQSCLAKQNLKNVAACCRHRWVSGVTLIAHLSFLSSTPGEEPGGSWSGPCQSGRSCGLC